MTGTVPGDGFINKMHYRRSWTPGASYISPPLSSGSVKCQQNLSDDSSDEERGTVCHVFRLPQPTDRMAGYGNLPGLFVS